ncbi:alpha/beta hydrolase fold domain-containing protein [Streptomyces sp. NPDC008092]|uniref:alpha/beta hydrolase fold domain-containing protein n=1 Tax=Streptomyces sp. NPDC008092 TaxID=3364808 RepID=UPI0036E83B83
MSSIQMRALALFLRLVVRPRTAASDPTARQGPAVAPVGPSAALRRRHEVSRRDVEGFVCHTVAPRDRRAERAVVYLHGGAYVREMAPQHWQFVSRLADAGLRVEVPHYGLAPHHTYREAYPFVTAVYRQLLDHVGSDRVSVMGDSAGAGLALGFTQTLAGAGLPQPGRLVLISPWLDLALANPDIPEVEARDPWLTTTGLLRAGRSWAGGDDPTDPRLSPIHGPLSPLPETDVYIGTRDLFHPDVLLLAQRAASAGTRINLTELDGGVHVYPITPVSEGRAAARAIVRSVSA